MIRRVLPLLTALLPLCPVAVAAQPVTSLTCLLAPHRESAIGTDSPGVVARVLVARAAQVRQGDPLIELDDRLEVAELRRAQVARDNAADRLARGEDLARGRTISQEELGELRAEYAMAEAELDKARLRVDRMRITAPFEATVAQVGVEEGELIGRDPVITLVDLSRLKVEMAFEDSDFGRLAVGDIVQVTATLTGQVARARVVTVDAFIDPAANAFQVVAEIDQPDVATPAGSNCIAAF